MATNEAQTTTVSYPYMPKVGRILYVDSNDPFMQAARAVAQEQSLDSTMPTGSVIVLDGVVLGRGANGSTYHQNNPCERVRQNIPTGQGYELCEGCHPKNHSEPTAIRDALAAHPSQNLAGAELYLWGHWWCCEPCWTAMTDNGITTVYLLEDSQTLFNKDAADNVVGRQLEATAPEGE